MTDSDRIRIFNDHLRILHRGGMVVISRGIAAMPRTAWADIIVAVARFNDFTADNDPYAQQGCASADFDCLPVIYKIDYFDPSMLHFSDDPANPRITRRVMTIMLAEEY